MKTPTTEEIIQMCKIYNSSDYDFFEYVKQFCNNDQLEIVTRLLFLNNETMIGWGDKPYSHNDLDEYYNKKWEILSYFGITNDGGDATYEGKFYQ